MKQYKFQNLLQYNVNTTTTTTTTTTVFWLCLICQFFQGYFRLCHKSQEWSQPRELSEQNILHVGCLSKCH